MPGFIICSFSRRRLPRHKNDSTPPGWAARSWHRSIPSNECGYRSVNTTKRATKSSIARHSKLLGKRSTPHLSRARAEYSSFLMYLDCYPIQSKTDSYNFPFFRRLNYPLIAIHVIYTPWVHAMQFEAAHEQTQLQQRNLPYIVESKQSDDSEMFVLPRWLCIYNSKCHIAQKTSSLSSHRIDMTQRKRRERE